MDLVKRSDSFSKIEVGDIDYFAVGICNVSENQNHVGIYIKDIDEDAQPDSLYFLHQPFHNTKTLEPEIELRNRESYFGIKRGFLGYSDFRLETITINILALGRKNETGIPYSVVYNPSIEYFHDGEYKKYDLGEGLSCATFVVECFKSANVNLINFDGWKKREELSDWPTPLLNLLKKYNPNDTEHFNLQKDLIQLRVRPEEAAICVALHEIGKSMNQEDICLPSELLNEYVRSRSCTV